MLYYLSYYLSKKAIQLKKEDYLFFIKKAIINENIEKIILIELNKIIRLQSVILLFSLVLVLCIPLFLIENTYPIWGAAISNTILGATILYTYRNNEIERNKLRTDKDIEFLSNTIRYIFKKEIKIMLLNGNYFQANILTYTTNKLTIQEIYNELYLDDNQKLKSYAKTYIFNNQSNILYSDLLFFEKTKDPEFAPLLINIIKEKQDRLRGSVSDF